MKRLMKAILLTSSITFSGLFLMLILGWVFLGIGSTLDRIADNIDYLLATYLIHLAAWWIFYEIRYRGGIDP